MHRRQYLSLATTTYTIGLAGCSRQISSGRNAVDEPRHTPTDTYEGPDRPSEDEIQADAEQLVDGTTIQYPAALDRTAEVTDENRITFPDLEMHFRFGATDAFTVTRDLSVSELAAWIAPVYEGDYDWTYHVFANQQFIDAAAEWTAFAMDSNRMGSFKEQVAWRSVGDVYHTYLPGRQGDYAGVVEPHDQRPLYQSPGIQLRPDIEVPEVGLTFDYDEESKHLEIKHHSGDPFHAENMMIHSNVDSADIKPIEPFTGAVTQGDTAVYDISDLDPKDKVYVSVQVGTTGRGLGSFTVPDPDEEDRTSY